MFFCPCSSLLESPQAKEKRTINSKAAEKKAESQR